MSDFETGDVVVFSPRGDWTEEGVVVRVWDKPASDPYVTIVTTEDHRQARTFVRCSSEVKAAI